MSRVLGSCPKACANHASDVPHPSHTVPGCFASTATWIALGALEPQNIVQYMYCMHLWGL